MAWRFGRTARWSGRIPSHFPPKAPRELALNIRLIFATRWGYVKPFPRMGARFRGWGCAGETVHPRTTLRESMNRGSERRPNSFPDNRMWSGTLVAPLDSPESRGATTPDPGTSTRPEWRLVPQSGGEGTLK